MKGQADRIHRVPHADEANPDVDRIGVPLLEPPPLLFDGFTNSCFSIG